MPKVRTYELRTKSKKDLEEDLKRLKTELAELRVIKQTAGTPSRVAKISFVRKSIARILTVINQTQKAHLRAEFKKANPKYTPLDLRAKKTRAIRRRLTPGQAAATSLRAQRRLSRFPHKKFAVKA